MKEHCIYADHQEKNPVARAAAALPVLDPPKFEELHQRIVKSTDSHIPKPTVRQRHGKLFNELDLGSLDSWTLELADAAHLLLAKYHDVFSLDPTELGWSHPKEHIIKMTDNTPFKEWFRQIPPPLVEEVRNHLKKMLESSPLDPARVPGVMPLY